MLTWLDPVTFALCVATWLGPMISSALKGQSRLLHPNGLFPLATVWLALVPLIYRIQDDTLLLTSRSIAGDPWFLAGPYLILALTGIFYHVGVASSGTSPTLGPEDGVSPYAELPTVQGLWAPGMMISGLLMLALACLAMWRYQILEGEEGVEWGIFWLIPLFQSFYIFPVAVLNQDRWIGTLFTLIALPATTLTRSKAAFLYFAVAMLLFYQGKVLKISKPVTIAIIIAMLATPLAVLRYRDEEYRSLSDVFFTGDSWRMALDIIGRREYAFECFACVYYEGGGGQFKEWGEETLLDIQAMIPHFLYPGKPDVKGRFLVQHIPEDLSRWHILAGITRHWLTPWYIDFGIVGCCLATFAFGLINGLMYRKARTLSLRRREIWPLIMYLGVAAQYHSLVGAGMAYAVPSALVTVASLTLLILVAFLLK